MHLPHHSSVACAGGDTSTRDDDSTTITRVIEGRVSEGWRSDRLLDPASKYVVLIIFFMRSFSFIHTPTKSTPHLHHESGRRHSEVPLCRRSTAVKANYQAHHSLIAAISGTRYAKVYDPNSTHAPKSRGGKSRGAGANGGAGGGGGGSSHGGGGSAKSLRRSSPNIAVRGKSPRGGAPEPRSVGATEGLGWGLRIFHELGSLAHEPMNLCCRFVEPCEVIVLILTWLLHIHL